MKKITSTGLILVMILATGQVDAAKINRTFYDVRDYGAVGDGIALNTQAIQKTIDTCAEAGGGTVYFPPGSYKAGSLHLKSNVTIRLEAIAVLLQSKDMKDYIQPEDRSYVHHTGSRYVFLHAQNVRNVSIVGGGTIDGNSALDGSEEKPRRGPLPILFENAESLLIKDVTVTNSPGWSITFFGCKHVDVIRAKCLDSYADGINPVCSQDVLYDGVLISGARDDSIAIKNDSTGYSYETRPQCGYLSTDIVITNTTIRNARQGHPAVKIGTGTAGIFRNIIVSNCTFENTGAMFTIQLMRPKHKKTKERRIENITFADITAKNVRGLFDLTSMDVTGSIIRNISINNVIADNVTTPSFIYGLADAPISDVTLNNIKLTHRDSSADHWLKTRYVHGLKLSNVQLDLAGSVKSALVCENTTDIELDSINIKGTVDSEPAVKLNQVKGAFIHSCQAPPVKTFLYVEGDRTEDISLIGNDMRKVKIPFCASPEIREGTVFPAAEKVECSNLSVPEDINANESIEVSVTFTNTANAGAFKAEVYVDGELAGSKWLWLEQEQRLPVTLTTHRYYEPRPYTIRVGSLTATTSVKPGPATFEFGDRMKINSPAAAGELTTVAVSLKNIGGSRGTEEVKLYADDQIVASEKVTLAPGQEKEVTVEHIFDKPGPHKLKIADFPVWPFATFTNTRANFYQTRDRIIIEGAGGRYNIRTDERQYAAVYLKGVKGDFRATANVLRQQATGPYAGGGLIVKNDMTKPQDSSGCVIGWQFPKYKVASFERPMFYQISKIGKTFNGKGRMWRVSPKDAEDVQDVGIFSNAHSTKGELCRVEFEYFKLEQPTRQDTVE